MTSCSDTPGPSKYVAMCGSHSRTSQVSPLPFAGSRASRTKGALSAVAGVQPLRPRPVPRRVERRVKRERLANGQHRIEVRLLGHESYARQDGGYVAGDRAAQQLDAAGERSQQPEHEPDRRGLTAAIWAEKAVNGPLRDVQVQILDLEGPAGAIAQSLDLDGVGHGAPTPISSATAACSSCRDTPRRAA